MKEVLIMTKKEKLEKFVSDCIDKYRFDRVKSEGREFCIIHTPLGLLRISNIESDRKISSIFMRFDNPELASRRVDCNPYTGKWNIIYRDIEDTKYVFDSYMYRLFLMEEKIQRSENNDMKAEDYCSAKEVRKTILEKFCNNTYELGGLERLESLFKEFDQKAKKVKRGEGKATRYYYRKSEFMKFMKAVANR